MYHICDWIKSLPHNRHRGQLIFPPWHRYLPRGEEWKYTLSVNANVIASFKCIIVLLTAISYQIKPANVIPVVRWHFVMLVFLHPSCTVKSLSATRNLSDGWNNTVMVVPFQFLCVLFFSTTTNLTHHVHFQDSEKWK